MRGGRAVEKRKRAVHDLWKTRWEDAESRISTLRPVHGGAEILWKSALDLWRGCGKPVDELSYCALDSNISRICATSDVAPSATISLMRAFGPGRSWPKMTPRSRSI